MKIDITVLSEDELIDLHRRIVERLRFLSQTRAHHKMLEFKVGDRVIFKPDDRPTLIGVLTKYNKKTVTVITENGEHWNVAPGLLTLAKDAKASENKQSNVIPMHRL
ncbi:MAG: hypothetical protein AABZ10_14000 [Nitrospirota bacterium]